jgi:predicted RNA-binding protein YlxR (DUF448 family)
MSRGGQPKNTEGLERRCIATGEVTDPAGMIRFVVGPEGQIVPDIRNKLPGRGIWVTADAEHLNMAIKKKLFSRSAKEQVSIPDDLFEQVEAALVRRLIDLISLARKAGQAVTGFEKVKGWLENEYARILIQSSDGSERGKSKLRSPPGKDVFVGCLTAQELGLAFGRESVIHGALSAGGLSKQVKAEAIRLRGVRGKSGEKVHPKGKDDA